MQFFASCPPGTADLLATELRELGVAQLREARLGVSFDSDLEHAYRACLWSRIASRVLMPLATFQADSAVELYDGVNAIAWWEHIAPGGTLAVDFAGSSRGITHTHFGALRTKDAIVDSIRQHSGERPSIELERPNVRIDVRLDRGRATVSIDLSGESLHRRGYRARGVAAPLKENLAASILIRSGWPQIAADGGALVDPMCGSGTLPIEAALIAYDIAPGLLRNYYGFLGWRRHDTRVWSELLREARERREAGLERRVDVRGYDRDPQAVRAALENIERAQLRGRVHIERRDLEQLAAEAERTGLVVVNPPYGERIGDLDQLRTLYRSLGEQLREQFDGWQAAILTGNPPIARELGINARRSHTLFNGKIECRLLRFDLGLENNRLRMLPSAEERQQALRESPGAQMFSNRLRKNLKQQKSWADRERVHCYRVYDADMPEYAFAVDLYGNEAEQWAYVQEYAPPTSIDPQGARTRRQQALSVIPDVLQLPSERIHLRVRQQQAGLSQYEKLEGTREFQQVIEGPHRFWVNFRDYLDTGLFLDHRLTRARIGQMSAGKRFLNLFAYTGTATVYAAGGGASGTTTIDMSRTYLDWAKRNMLLNGFAGPEHGFVQADCMAWLVEQQQQRRKPYDLIFIDPPTHSRSKRMEDDFDVQRDHVRLLQLAGSLLAAGGTMVFSNNYTRFRIDAEALSRMFDIEDISAATIPKDFVRNQRIHRAFLLRPR
ncbi:MAG: bifunctional 23S rRNA (guanine(2069)-N(7))-methyltransferase RlmK/23S rRNA (guanine(2445)-N(2))-methyltransferase RlmL [Steroidobacteraceae bacterium]